MSYSRFLQDAASAEIVSDVRASFNVGDIFSVCTGTRRAAYVASQMMLFFEGTHAIIILFAVGILATLFSLVMSNVTTTVLLVLLVMIIGDFSGINPRGLALLVALCASNSFVLPTHQVNALIMSPGRYENTDFIKAGGIMTIIFITISVILIYLFYL